MKCKICGNETVLFDTATVLYKYDVQYYRCPHCDFLQTEEPFWLDEAYEDAILESDIGLAGRNIYFSKTISAILKICFPEAKTYLDFGGGYGLFVRLMRDNGFPFEWYDKYCENLFSPHFKKSRSHYDIITAFELIEHMPDPLNGLKELLNMGQSVIFSTILLPPSVPKIQDWWYYGPDAGQHISFFSSKTFELIAAKYHCQYSHYDSLHILSQIKIPEWKLKLILRFSGMVNRFIKRESLLAEDFTHITGQVL